MKLPVLAIVGRPNVGKSTIFNRLTKSRKAITSPISGVTRDRHVGTVEWGGRSFIVTDTGGWVPKTTDMYEIAIREQVEFALESCDLVLFVCDGQTGPTDVDMDIARMLQRSNRDVILAVNKSDSPKIDAEVPAFYTLGVGDPQAISAVAGHGFGDLLDLIVEQLPDTDTADLPSRPRPLVAVIGRPNVGKSSFVNAILGEQRHMVTDQAGTTRDSIDSVVTFYKQPLTLIDTAGLRRRARVKEALEYYTTVRTQKALTDCDVAVILIDVSEGLLAQDVKIINEAAGFGKGIVLCINKWDLFEKDSKSAHQIERDIDERLASFSYVPKMFISAKEKQRVHKVLEKVFQIYEERQKRISTSELNRFIEELMEVTPPPSIKGRDLRFNYVTQVEIAPPLFAFFGKYPELLTANYRSFLERKFREKYGFEGVPLRLTFRKKQ
ncbi:ribosome biogenesis GTPase Der [bacterium]|nr:ribosome biogenesis GTPase Der [bacterium]